VQEIDKDIISITRAHRFVMEKCRAKQIMCNAYELIDLLQAFLLKTRLHPLKFIGEDDFINHVQIAKRLEEC
jgi:hypothetical protein